MVYGQIHALATLPNYVYMLVFLSPLNPRQQLHLFAFILRNRAHLFTSRDTCSSPT